MPADREGNPQAASAKYPIARDDQQCDRALAAAEVQTLLEENWTALASGSLAEAPAPDVVAAIIRVTGGNFRRITRLLTQMERVFKINQLKHLFPAVAETARENLVIGQV